jgi:hypothetical protein
MFQSQQQLGKTFETFQFLKNEGGETLELQNQMLETMNIFRTFLGLEQFKESLDESFEAYFDRFNELLLNNALERNVSSLIDLYIEKLGTPDFHVGKIAWEVMAKSKNVRIVIHTINERDTSNPYPVIDTINTQGPVENEVHLVFQSRHYDYLGPIH